MAKIYQQVVGLRFARVNKIYNFDSTGFVLTEGDNVVVETSRGKQIGTVMTMYTNFEWDGEPLKLVDHVATPRELISREIWNSKVDEVIEFTKKRAKELEIPGIKILNAEYSYDGSRILITFSSQNEDKVDLKSLKYDIQKAFTNINSAEIRQLGPRDVAKAICGMGACGMPNRCCSTYLTEFSSISIKMAKEQGISLTPAEITGMCGRLRCCLVFENDYYVECRKHMPKKNKHVGTPQGEGKVLEVFPLRDMVLVDIPEVGRREFPTDQITFDDPNAVKGEKIDNTANK